MLVIALILAAVSFAIFAGNGSANCNYVSNSITCNIVEFGGDMRVGADITVTDAPLDAFGFSAVINDVDAINFTSIEFRPPGTGSPSAVSTVGVPISTVQSNLPYRVCWVEVSADIPNAPASCNQVVVYSNVLAGYSVAAFLGRGISIDHLSGSGYFDVDFNWIVDQSPCYAELTFPESNSLDTQYWAASPSSGGWTWSGGEMYFPVNGSGFVGALTGQQIATLAGYSGMTIQTGADIYMDFYTGGTNTDYLDIYSQQDNIFSDVLPSGGMIDYSSSVGGFASPVTFEYEGAYTGYMFVDDIYIYFDCSAIVASGTPTPSPTSPPAATGTPTSTPTAANTPTPTSLPTITPPSQHKQWEEELYQ